MGLKPVHFLALPRIVAGTLALPFLSLFATAAGLLGGWVVMVGAWTLAPEALWEGVEPPAGAVSEG